MSISIEKAVIARYDFKDKRFEILVDPEKALELKKGKPIDIREILAVYEIYKDSRKAERASIEDIERVFHTKDIFKAAEEIIKRGEFHLTAEQKRKMIEEKKMQIATIISRKSINPQTNTPHPPQRILNAMEQARVSIDPLMDAELQVDKVLKEIKKLLPIRIEVSIVEIKIPAQYSGFAYSQIKRFPIEIIEESWLNDGSLKLKIKISSGMRDDLFGKIASITHGNFESRILETKGV